ncbi:hypothetical protein PC118_g21164 [Phytophthora cactorum]|uniref:Uncharacterized protein n=1 Tax=Phytophthora cactorum TaxID=29920 RepID=A0A8T1F7K7_9STRA|nr:hypothetical protein PC118_g21164 [Phytophthora cactorum]
MEMESTRRYTNLAPVCEETNTLDMKNITKAVEQSIRGELPEQFGAILDGWTHGSEHYLAAHACYDRNGVRHCPLLSMAPIINGPDDHLNVEYHIRYLCAAKLRLKTHLQPKLRQNTRWESTYTMMARHLVLREFISAEDEELAEEMPSTATNRNLKALLGQLADAQSVAMELLCAELNLLDARDLLNGLLEVMPSFGDYLAPNAEIVHAPDFDGALPHAI